MVPLWHLEILYFWNLLLSNYYAGVYEVHKLSWTKGSLRERDWTSLDTGLCLFPVIDEQNIAFDFKTEWFLEKNLNNRWINVKRLWKENYNSEK